MIGAVVADLFQTAQRRKISDRIGEHGLALERHTCGDSRHTLLGDSRVDELVGKRFPERAQNSETEVARDKSQVFIFFSEVDKLADHGISHFDSTSLS